MYCHILHVRAIPTLESTDSMILVYISKSARVLCFYYSCMCIANEMYHVPKYESMPTALGHSTPALGCTSVPRQKLPSELKTCMLATQHQTKVLLLVPGPALPLKMRDLRGRHLDVGAVCIRNMHMHT